MAKHNISFLLGDVIKISCFIYCKNSTLTSGLGKGIFLSEKKKPPWRAVFLRFFELALVKPR